MTIRSYPWSPQQVYIWRPEKSINWATERRRPTFCLLRTPHVLRVSLAQWEQCSTVSMLLIMPIHRPFVCSYVNKLSCKCTEENDRAYVLLFVIYVADMNSVVASVPTCGMPGRSSIRPATKSQSLLCAIDSILVIKRRWTNCWARHLRWPAIVRIVHRNVPSPTSSSKPRLSTLHSHGKRIVSKHLFRIPQFHCLSIGQRIGRHKSTLVMLASVWYEKRRLSKTTPKQRRSVWSMFCQIAEASLAYGLASVSSRWWK